jgi:hypothetical protein
MRIGREQVLEHLKRHGGDDKLEQARRELPEHVDTKADAELLESLGLKSGDLASLAEGGGYGD